MTARGAWSPSAEADALPPPAGDREAEADFGRAIEDNNDDEGTKTNAAAASAEVNEDAADAAPVPVPAADDAATESEPAEGTAEGTL